MPGISAADLEQQSFYELLEKGPLRHHDRRRPADDRADGHEREGVLGVGRAAPLAAFVFERTTRSESGEIVEYVRSIYRGDRYRLVTELNRRSFGRAGNGLQ